MDHTFGPPPIARRRGTRDRRTPPDLLLVREQESPWAQAPTAEACPTHPHPVRRGGSRREPPTCARSAPTRRHSWSPNRPAPKRRDRMRWARHLRVDAPIEHNGRSARWVAKNRSLRSARPLRVVKQAVAWFGRAGSRAGWAGSAHLRTTQRNAVPMWFASRRENSPLPARGQLHHSSGVRRFGWVTGLRNEHATARAERSGVRRRHGAPRPAAAELGTRNCAGAV